MPYNSVSQLPESAKNLSDADKKIFMAAFNAAIKEYGDEETAFKVAHSAVNKSKHKQDKEDTEEKVSFNRYDSTSFSSKPEKTSQGFLKVFANISRTGVFVYRNPNGSIRRELRLPEEVFSKKALSSLSSAPLTLNHPVDAMGNAVLVNARNSKKYTVGMLGEQIHADGKFISSSLTIMDEDAISAVEDNKMREISSGYKCDLEDTSGVWNGEHFDGIQRNIVYNHVAIVNKGRAGSEVSIRMDASDAAAEYEENNKEEPQMENLTLNVDGLDLEVPKATAQAFELAFKKREDESNVLKSEIEGLKGQLDAMKADLESQSKARADAEDPSRINEAVMARVSLVTKARKVLGEEADLYSLQDRQIKELVIKKQNPELILDEAKDAYIDGRFDTVIENHTARTDSLSATRAAAEVAARGDADVKTFDPEALKLKLKQSWVDRSNK